MFCLRRSNSLICKNSYAQETKIQQQKFIEIAENCNSMQVHTRKSCSRVVSPLAEFLQYCSILGLLEGLQLRGGCNIDGIHR